MISVSRNQAQIEWNSGTQHILVIFLSARVTKNFTQEKRIEKREEKTQRLRINNRIYGNW